jgi:hypothetical protein
MLIIRQTSILLLSSLFSISKKNLSAQTDRFCKKNDIDLFPYSISAFTVIFNNDFIGSFVLRYT